MYYSVFWYFLAKIGVDTAENELRVNPNRVRVLRVTLRVTLRVQWLPKVPRDDADEGSAATQALATQVP